MEKYIILHFQEFEGANMMSVKFILHITKNVTLNLLFVKKVKIS